LNELDIVEAEMRYKVKYFGFHFFQIPDTPFIYKKQAPIFSEYDYVREISEEPDWILSKNTSTIIIDEYTPEKLRG
jgi:hypothetical protein